jgi:sporulation protein YlmC with PRC-barrel domain
MDLGTPASYRTLAGGTPVLTSDGKEIGRVEHVLADADADVFDGIVVDVSAGPGGHRFVDAPQVAEIYEQGVVLSLDRAAADRLPEPSANPATLEADPADTASSDLSNKLRRAWDYLSGNY